MTEERLKEIALAYRRGWQSEGQQVPADLVAELLAEITQLRGALKPLAAMHCDRAPSYPLPSYIDRWVVQCGRCDVCRARAALGGRPVTAG